MPAQGSFEGLANVCQVRRTTEVAVNMDDPSHEPAVGGYLPLEMPAVDLSDGPAVNRTVSALTIGGTGWVQPWVIEAPTDGTSW